MPAKAKTTSSSLKGAWTKNPPTSHFVEEFYYDTINTTTVLPLKTSEGNPILFYIPGLDKINVALDQIWLQIRIRILGKNEDGTLAPLADKLKLTPLCGILYTLFSDIELFLNDEMLDSSKQNYQVESYVHHLLDTTAQEKGSLLSAALFFPDKAGSFELVDADDKKTNPGAYERYNRIAKSAVCELAGKVWLPFFDSDKSFLLDKCSLALRFYPNPPKRSLVQAMLAATDKAPEYEIEILTAELQVGRLKLRNPSVPRATYNFDKIRTLRIPSPKGLQICGPFEIHRGLAPSLVRIVIQSEKQVDGTIKSNRLKFENWSVREISLRLAGRALPWKTGLACDFKNNNYTSAYLSLLNEGAKRNKDMMITYDDYNSGYTIFSFDCTSGHDQSIKSENGEQQSPRIEGSLEMTCTFDKAPTEAVVFIAICYFPSTVTIDNNRKFQIADTAMSSSGGRMTRSF